MDKDRTTFIQGLRELADFLDCHPDVITPSDTVVNVFAHKDELIQAARASTWQKCYGDDYFWLRKDFSGVRYEINTNRAAVCRRIVKGTKVVPAEPEKIVEDVEWVCDEPLLAADHG